MGISSHPPKPRHLGKMSKAIRHSTRLRALHGMGGAMGELVVWCRVERRFLGGLRIEHIWTCWMPQKIGATDFEKLSGLKGVFMESWNILKLVESLEAQEVGWEKHLESMWAWRLGEGFFVAMGIPWESDGIRWPKHQVILEVSVLPWNVQI